jgi:hypothetical protein
MFDKAVILKGVVELPSKTVSVSLGRAAVTSRVAITRGTRVSDFSESLHLLSDKPLRRPPPRKPDST